MNYWLMKSEPRCFSLEDLKSRRARSEPWDGVRNYQARNFMRAMRLGDKTFFYHSSCRVPGIVGVAEVTRTAYPDPTQFDPNDEHYDPKSSPDAPRWDLVDVGFVAAFAKTVTLQRLREIPELAEFPLLRKGNRLSVMPVAKAYWKRIMELAGDD